MGKDLKRDQEPVSPQPFSPEMDLVETIYGGFDHYGHGEPRDELSPAAQEARNSFIAKVLSDMENRPNNPKSREYAQVLRLMHGIDTRKKGSLDKTAEAIGKRKDVIRELQARGHREFRSNSSVRPKIELFLPYENNTVARSVGITCKYDLLTKMAGEIDIEETKADKIKKLVSQIPANTQTALEMTLEDTTPENFEATC